MKRARMLKGIHNRTLFTRYAKTASSISFPPSPKYIEQLASFRLAKRTRFQPLVAVDPNVRVVAGIPVLHV